MEDFLIQRRSLATLISVMSGNKSEKWSISGVVRNEGEGEHPSAKEQAFSALMGLKKSWPLDRNAVRLPRRRRLPE